MAQQRMNDRLPAVRPAAEGDETAFAAALAGTMALLRGRAMMMVGRVTLADDLVQDTYERALRSRQRPQAEEMERWLMRILKNLVIDRWRSERHARACALDEEHTVEAATPPREESIQDESWWQNFTKEDVTGAMEQLPAEFHQILVARTVEGCSYTEIARRLALKPGTVATRLYRARQRLRRVLETMRPGGTAPSSPLPS